MGNILKKQGGIERRDVETEMGLAGGGGTAGDAGRADGVCGAP